MLIDTPAGSRNKYRFDPSSHALCVTRVLPDGLSFPHNYGSIPGTLADDGDALDALVVGLPPAFPGCRVTTRLLGILRARQRERGRTVRNDRIIACAETEATPARFKTLRQLGESRVHAIELFFETYNRAQGRPFHLESRGSARAAYTAVQHAARRYQVDEGEASR